MMHRLLALLIPLLVGGTWGATLSSQSATGADGPKAFCQNTLCTDTCTITISSGGFLTSTDDCGGASSTSIGTIMSGEDGLSVTLAPICYNDDCTLTCTWTFVNGLLSDAAEDACDEVGQGWGPFGTGTQVVTVTTGALCESSLCTAPDCVLTWTKGRLTARAGC